MREKMINTIISHYKILEKLGEGGVFEVFLAENTAERFYFNFYRIKMYLKQTQSHRVVGVNTGEMAPNCYSAAEIATLDSSQKLSLNTFVLSCL